ncbi:hypothetical protein HII31_00698 [Pseudocercospora fuligena]|uniref:Uncharacterized protein n=1 Tax=Pseudocercospora fuligena TaxID=685502 RepID=A0A8H6VRL5_9PEZI|nr:hypothetical protein HII31_00698 [Pseudocercospora fuligena]
MDAFKFPPRESLQPLSPERVNGSTRPLSGMSSKTTSTSDYPENPSPHSSPRRKAANLFADYDPKRHSPVKESGFALPASPSLPEIHAFRSHGRTNSDVQGLVKRFEHLDVRDRDAEWEGRKKRHEAELRRAQIAREEAENDVKRLREEVRRLKRDGDEGRDRERKLGKRLEVVAEEFANFKESQTSQHSVYEKEVRKARKEAFKTSSAVLKLQEELKSTRNTLRITQSGLDMEKRKVAQREQQTFDAQYQLVAVQEELDKMKTQLKTVEEEKNALKTSLKEEEVARIAAEGMIALPLGNHDDDDLMSPQVRRRSPHKRPQSPLSDDKENVGVVTKKMVEARQLSEELGRERMRREEAEELVEFLRLECKFQCCGCRVRKDSAHDLLVTNPFAAALENIRDTMRAVITPPASETEHTEPSIVIKREPSTEVQIKTEVSEDVSMEESAARDSPMEGLDRSMTMDHEPEFEEQLVEEAVVDEEEPMAPRPTPMEPEAQPDENGEPMPTLATMKVPLAPSSPQSPAHSQAQTTPYRPGYVRTITTTTTIPMHFTPQKPKFDAMQDAENIPPTTMSPRDRSGAAPTFDREAALAAIAYRRGRAKSIANGHMTPRKQMMEGVNIKERRDISAPALGQKSHAAKVNLGKGVGSASRTR